MKRWILLILMIISLLSFFYMYLKVDYEFISHVKKGEQSDNTYHFELNPDIEKKDMQDVIATLMETAKEEEANLYYTFISSDGKSIDKYVFLSSYNYINKFNLEKGTGLLIQDMHQMSMLATEDYSGTENLSGIITGFANKYHVRIKTLMYMIEDNRSLANQLAVEVEADKLNAFKTKLENRLNIEKLEFSIYTKSNDITSGLKWGLILSYIILTLLIFYEILLKTKTYGIKKLVGYSTLKIYFHEFVPYLGQTFLISSSIFVIGSICTFMPFSDKSILFFSLHLWKAELWLLCLTTLAISHPYLMVEFISVSHMLKNKKPISKIILINGLVKIIITFILFFMVSSNYEMLLVNKTNFDQFAGWLGTQNYYVLPTLRGIPEFFMNDPEFLVKQKELYEVFNEKGAILADFHLLEPQYLDLSRSNEAYKEKYQHEVGTINPNYLNQHPVYNEDGKRIYIDETSSNFIVLVPVKFKKHEIEIRATYDMIKNGYPSKDVGTSNRPIPSQILEIIWIQDKQDIFTYNSRINPAIGNTYQDLSLRVLTESNGALTDYDCILAIGSNPFKIKAITEDPINEIRQVLESAGMNQYIPNIYNLYDYVSLELAERKSMTQLTRLVLCALFIITLMMMVQNIYGYLEKRRREIAVKRLCGYSFFGQYKAYGWLIIMSWVLPLIYLIFGNARNQVGGSLIIGILFFVEVLFSCLVLLWHKNTRNVIVIKGE